MSRQVIGGAIGIALSFATGGAFTPLMGFMIGSTAASILFPETMEGPRLEDLRPQASEYGRPVAIVLGKGPVGGNVMWAADLIEESHEEGGSFFGGGTTVYDYYANFAILICDAETGEKALGKIWAGPDRRLVYDPATGEVEGGGSITFYSGSTTQLPDPLMESYEGVGNVPAYRGYCYVVFERFPLKKDGNRIPFLTIEVGDDPAAASENLGIVWWQSIWTNDDKLFAAYYGSYHGVLVRDLADMSPVANIPVDQVEWSISDYLFHDPARGVIIRANKNSGGPYKVTTVSTGSESDQIVPGIGGGHYLRGAAYYGGNYVFAYWHEAATAVVIVTVDPDTFAASATHTYDSGSSEQITGPLLPGASALIAGCATNIRRYPQDGSFVSTSLGAKAGDYVAIDPNTGLVWSAGVDAPDLTVTLTHQDTGFVYSSTTSTLLWHVAGAAPFLFIPDVGGYSKVYVCGERGGAWTDYYVEYDSMAGGYVGEGDGTYHGIAELGGVFYNNVTDEIGGIRNRNGVYAVGTSLDPVSIPYESGYMGSAGASLQGTTLDVVVTKLSALADQDASMIDVTELTDSVDGYVIATQTTVKDAIAKLCPAYYFDGVESDVTMKYVKRGGAVAAVIDEDEIGAYKSGSDPAERQGARRMEDELPLTLYVNYMLEATKYQKATQYSRRLIGDSGNQETLDLPLVLTDTKAKQISQANLHGLWVERVSHTFTLPRKYAYLEPTDIIALPNGIGTVRLVKITQDGGIYRCEAVDDDSEVYSPVVIVTETVADPDEAVAQATLTTLELM